MSSVLAKGGEVDKHVAADTEAFDRRETHAASGHLRGERRAGLDEVVAKAGHSKPRNGRDREGRVEGDSVERRTGPLTFEASRTRASAPAERRYRCRAVGIACMPTPERQSQPLYRRFAPLKTPRKLVPIAIFLLVVESLIELPMVQYVPPLLLLPGMIWENASTSYVDTAAMLEVLYARAETPTAPALAPEPIPSPYVVSSVSSVGTSAGSAMPPTPEGACWPKAADAGHSIVNRPTIAAARKAGFPPMGSTPAEANSDGSPFQIVDSGAVRCWTHAAPGDLRPVRCLHAQRARSVLYSRTSWLAHRANS